MIVLTGIVTKIDDDENLGRVKVKFPQLDDKLETHWCRLVSTGGGDKRGIQFIPEVGDEVLIVGPNMFDLFVVGGLWSKVDLPPYKSNQAATARDVNKRVIRSRTGHEILLDDSSSPKIVIVDKTGKNSLTIDSSDNSMKIEVDGDIVLRSRRGAVTLDSALGMSAKAGTTFAVEANATASVKATGNASLEGTGSTSVRSGGVVTLSGSAVSLG